MEEGEDLTFRVCIDERDFLPGRFITENISTNMAHSRKIIFVVTRRFISSCWCSFEVEIAQTRIVDENTGMIIIVFLEDIPKRDLPKSLRRLARRVTHITWIDTARGRELFWKKLKLALDC